MTAWETLLSLLCAAVGVALTRMVVMLVLRLALLAVVVVVLGNLLWQHGLAADESAPCPPAPAAQALPALVGCSMPPPPP